jgi:hypothetical protein
MPPGTNKLTEAKRRQPTGLGTLKAERKRHDTSAP